MAELSVCSPLFAVDRQQQEKDSGGGGCCACLAGALLCCCAEGASFLRLRCGRPCCVLISAPCCIQRSAAIVSSSSLMPSHARDILCLRAALAILPGFPPSMIIPLGPVSAMQCSIRLLVTTQVLMTLSVWINHALSCCIFSPRMRHVFAIEMRDERADQERERARARSAPCSPATSHAPVHRSPSSQSRHPLPYSKCSPGSLRGP